MTNKPSEEKKHEHIWKYVGNGNERVCEAPFPTIEDCRRIEAKDKDGEWVLIHPGKSMTNPNKVTLKDSAIEGWEKEEVG